VTICAGLLDRVRAIENDLGTLATGVTFVVSVLAGNHDSQSSSASTPLRSTPRRRRSSRGVSIQIRKLRCAAHSERPAETPSMMTIGAGSTVCHSANVSDSQSWRWQRAASPRANGSMTCSRSRGHQSIGLSANAESSPRPPAAPECQGPIPTLAPQQVSSLTHRITAMSITRACLR